MRKNLKSKGLITTSKKLGNSDSVHQENQILYHRQTQSYSILQQSIKKQQQQQKSQFDNITFNRMSDSEYQSEELSEQYEQQSDGQKQEKSLPKKKRKTDGNVKLQSSQQIYHPSQSQSMNEKKKRKVRTTITIEKLKEMNKVFQEYRNDAHGTIKLKQISQKLGLGYSTVLHKYKQFKKNNKVKGGALIQSMFQKRKYKKSLQIQYHINKALESSNFFTANQLASYIKEHYGKEYSRSIISRHLGQMGYSYKNIKNQEDESQNESSSPIQVMIDKDVLTMKKQFLFASALLKLIKNKETVLFLHQIHFVVEKYIGEDNQHHSKKRKDVYTVNRVSFEGNQYNSDLLTLVVVANLQQVCFYRFQKGPYSQLQFSNELKQIVKSLETSNPCSQISAQQVHRQVLPEIKEVASIDDLQRDYFFEQDYCHSRKQQQVIQQPLKQEQTYQKAPIFDIFKMQPKVQQPKKEEGDKYESQKQQSQKHQSVKQSCEHEKQFKQNQSQKQKLQDKQNIELKPRFLVLSFQQCHKQAQQQQQQQNLYDLLVSHQIIPLYTPPSIKDKLNMLQLWYKMYLESIVQKKFNSQSLFINQCKFALESNAYNMEESFQKIKQEAEKIVKKEDFSIRSERRKRKNRENFQKQFQKESQIYKSENQEQFFTKK